MSHSIDYAKCRILVVGDSGSASQLVSLAISLTSAPASQAAARPLWCTAFAMALFCLIVAPFPPEFVAHRLCRASGWTRPTPIHMHERATRLLQRLRLQCLGPVGLRLPLGPLPLPVLPPALQNAIFASISTRSLPFMVLIPSAFLRCA